MRVYKSFYSLNKEPFTKEISPKDAFLSSDHQGALESLRYLGQSKGMGLVTGDSGMGKIFALRTVKESLNPALYHVVYLPHSTVSVIDFYRDLAYGLGEEPYSQKSRLFRQIQEGITQLVKDKRTVPVFIFDEMHLAKDAFLQDLALLFNFQMDSVNPFVLVLAGLPPLKQRLTLNHHRPLRQRLIMRYEFSPLPKDDVAQYIEHHLKLAGALAPIFTQSALEAIALRSEGTPRQINTIAMNCLLFGAQLKKEQIDEEIVRLAISEWGMI